MEWQHHLGPYLKHRYIFRDFVPDGTDGYQISWAGGDSLHFDWSYPIDPIYVLHRLMTTIFLQRTDRKIVQAASALVPDPAGVDLADLPLKIVLGQNAPNPFGPETRIDYYMSEGGVVRVSVYAPTGRFVTDLINRYVEPGSHMVTWDGRDRFGRQVGSGVYYYRLNAGDRSLNGKMILAR